MAKLDIDYSLPYDEAKKKYGHNGYFMSEDQYGLKQAEIASNKKIGLSPEAEDVYAEANAVKNGTSVAEEKALNQAAINRDNNPDVEDTRAIGATKEELDYMLQNGQISRAAYEKQIADLNTPEVQEEMAAGEKKADETVWDPSNRDATVADTVSDAVTPKENDTPKQAEAKGKYNKSMMSIWDAYRAGDIDKETAGYFTIDAIANLAKNLGRSIGNVGAQFSGGTIDNGHDSSLWEQRRGSMFNTELQKETEEVKTFDNILKGYQANRAATVNDMLKDFNAKANDPSLSETEKRFYQILAVQLAGAGLDGNAQIATIGSGVWDDIKSKFGEWFGKKDK